MALRATAGGMSRRECCFRKTVEMEMRTACRVKAVRHKGVAKRGVFQAAARTAREPMTWREGHTLVLVSKA